MKINVNDGRSIHFWTDKWLGNTTIKDRYPNLYKLSRHKDATIAKIMTEFTGLDFNFCRNLQRDEVRSLIQLVEELDSINLNREEDDLMEWNVAGEKKFTLKSCYDALSQDGNDNLDTDVIWRKNIPSKVAFWIWTATQNAIPTLDVLNNRGIPIINRCWFCKCKAETINHLLLHCTVTSQIWEYFIQAQKRIWVKNESLLKNLVEWRSGQGTHRGKKVWLLLPYAICWAIWLERNDRAFNSAENSVDNVIIKVKGFLYMWGLKDKIFEGLVFSDLCRNWVDIVSM
ncbi:Reverse transcriptase zinc-binding domain [Macleaya cordata]|uniref:Reverse transcriptase zinc-binding domain n=1 Tax=Macleaya cordata TaxID=56857 RepID=A0A200QA33_MACCD|nr:Reverse transcriptase zinc-binding domain [Macleaya cordata]